MRNRNISLLFLLKQTDDDFRNNKLLQALGILGLIFRTIYGRIRPK